MLSLSNKKIIPILIIAIMLTGILAVYVTTDKIPIEQATIDDIRAIDGLDIVLSTRIVNYIQNNPEADIDDLINVDGIGEKRLKLLKGKFK